MLPEWPPTPTAAPLSAPSSDWRAIVPPLPATRRFAAGSANTFSPSRQTSLNPSRSGPPKRPCPVWPRLFPATSPAKPAFAFRPRTATFCNLGCSPASKVEESNNLMGKLEGTVAVITAATSGMALATAKLFIEEGAYVFITGRRQDKLDEAVKAIGRNVTGVQGDASNLDDLDRLYETVKKTKGKID